MTPDEFRAIRSRLGFTQAGLAALLGYGQAVRISEFERGARDIPHLLAMVMRALDSGWRPNK